jgi:hypothetical protein
MREREDRYQVDLLIGNRLLCNQGWTFRTLLGVMTFVSVVEPTPMQRLSQNCDPQPISIALMRIVAALF